MAFGDVSGGGGGFGSVSTKKSPTRDLEELLLLAESQGKRPKEKTGVLTRIFNVLSAFEPGGELTTLAETGDIEEAGKQYVSEVGRGIGSAIPFLDPYTKPKELASERKGYTDFLEAIGWQPETTGGKIARGATGLAGDIFLDPGNLLLAPLFKGVARGAKGAGGVGAKLLAKTEKGQDILRSTARLRDLLGDAFKTGYRAKKVSPDLVDFTTKLKRTMNVGDDEAVNIVKKLVDKHGLETIKKLPYEIEEGGEILTKGAGKYKSADEFIRAINKSSPIRLISDRELKILKEAGELPVSSRWPTAGKVGIINTGKYDEVKPLLAEGLDKSKRHLVALDPKLGSDVSVGYLNLEKPISKSDIKQVIPNYKKVYNQATKKPGKKLSKAAQEVVNLIEEKTAREIPLGIRTAEVQDYFPRKVVREPFKGYAGGLPEIKPTLKGAEKSRVFKTLAEGEKAGYKYLEAPESLSLRLATSQRATKAKDALNKLIAGEIKDIGGNPIIRKAGSAGTKSMREFTKIKELKDYVAHPDVVDYLENVQKVFVNDDTTKNVLKIYDKIHNLWKGSVTSYFPAFHTRNAIGNIFNNFVAGVKNPKSYTDAAKLQKGTGKLDDVFKKIFPDAETFEEARKVMAEIGVTGKGQFAEDVPELFQKAIGQEGIGRKIAKTPRRVGTAIEDNARVAHFLEKVRKGNSFDEAAKSVNKFLFDYSDLTPFERNVMKRIFPFYTFSRKNVPLQFEQVFKQPRKYKAVADAVAGLQSGDLTPEEKRYMPDYITETFGISVDRGPGGEPQMLAGLGLPLEDVQKGGEPLKSLLDMASPLLKTPAEVATGRSFFYDSDIEDTSAYNATTEAIGDVPGLKQFLSAEKATNKAGNVYYRVDPKRMYLLKALAGRFVGTGEKLTDTRKSVLSRLMNALTGVKIYTPDIEKEKERKITEMLKELGVMRTFTKDYVPKSSTGFGQ